MDNENTKGRHFQDDQHPKFRLVQQVGFAENEYQIKDMLTRVYWREGAYFTAPDGGTKFDVEGFLKTKQFGSWMESFSAAASFEAANKGSDDPDVKKQLVGLDMHVLQQFFSNALFSAEEVERFDYQSSPLNYQDEHSYIRAAATSVADSLREQLAKKLKGDWTAKRLYLAQDMELRSIMSQLFSSITISSKEDLEPAALVKKLQPLTVPLTQYVMARAKKDEAEYRQPEREKLIDIETTSRELDKLKKEVKQQAQLKSTGNGSPAEIRLSDRLRDESDLIDALRNLNTAERELEKARKPPQKQQAKKSAKADPQGATTVATPIVAHTGPDPATIKLADQKVADLRVQIAQLENALGVTKTIGMRDANRNVEVDKTRAVLVNELAQQDPQSQFIGAMQARAAAQNKITSLEAEVQVIRNRDYVMLRNYEKVGSLTFVDFSDLLGAEAAKQANPEEQLPGWHKRVHTALEIAVTDQVIDEYIGWKFPQVKLDVRRELAKEIGAYLAARALLPAKVNEKVRAEQDVGLAANAPTTKSVVAPGIDDKNSSAQLLATALSPLYDLVQEIKSKTTKSQRGLDSVYVSGGMLKIDDKEGGYRQPALLVANEVMDAQITSAIGKSGHVPTPTDAARSMLSQGISLKEIVQSITTIQAARAKKGSDTRTKLDDINKKIAQFDPLAQTDVRGVTAHLKSVKVAFSEFVQLSESGIDQVRLLAAPVRKMIEALDVLNEDGKGPALPGIALAQLEQNLAGAVADQHDLVQFVRQIQNLHELIILALELGARPKVNTPIKVPDGAHDVHVTHYGLTAFTQVYNAVMQQNEAKSQITVAAYYDLYFEMMQKLGHTEHASGGRLKLDRPVNVKDFLAKYTKGSASGLTIAQPEIDLITIDIHPNDASQVAIHRQSVIELIQEIFGKTSADFRCTIMIDITLNHVADTEVADIKKAADDHIESGRLNLVFTQSLTKFAQLGTDKHSGGLMFHYNKGDGWKAFNDYVTEAISRDRIDPTIQSYFELLFATSEDEQKEYITKIRSNTRIVYDQLKLAFSRLGVESTVLELAENDDPGACYVAFHYKPFAAAVFAKDATGEMLRNMAREILFFDTIAKLAGKLGLPLNMRTSFGFPLSISAPSTPVSG